MQLERIVIEKLFGRFDYTIPLNRPERITIIHAPNGFGKTAVLTLVYAFFSGRFALLFKYHFRSLFLHFSSNEMLEIRRSEGGDLFSPKTREPSEIQIALLSSVRTSEAAFVINALEALPALNRHVPFLSPAGLDAWYDDNADEVLSTNDALARYSPSFPPEMLKRVKPPEWLQRFVNSTECRLIETQRLLRLERTEAIPTRYRPRQALPQRPVVEMEARDLANRIGATLADYANRAQSLDQSFPRRVIAALGSQEAPSASAVTARLRSVEQKRASLIEAGLLDKTGVPEILSQAELIGQAERQVIGVYLDDTEQKFSRVNAGAKMHQLAGAKIHRRCWQ